MTKQSEEEYEAESGQGFTGIEIEFGPENPARILPLVSGSGNRQLLSKWISNQPEFEVVSTQPDTATLPTVEFDLWPCLAASENGSMSKFLRY